MNSLYQWSDADAEEAVAKYRAVDINEDIALRTYSARLLGQDPNLVLHGGGNTSVKTSIDNQLGETREVLCVKGSGWDLATIEPAGHPAVELKALLQLRKLKSLSDEDMVALQRTNLIDPKSPNPSVETLLHAFIPDKFIDHTHSVAILALADQPDQQKIIEDIYGAKVAIVPYVMPGFDLALAAISCYEAAKQKALENQIELEGMILLNHGIFSFGSSAKQSYARMIGLVQAAEEHLAQLPNLQDSLKAPQSNQSQNNAEIISFLRGALARAAATKGQPKKWILEVRSNTDINQFLCLENIEELANRGVATPDHVIRTKHRPLLLAEPPRLRQDSPQNKLTGSAAEAWRHAVASKFSNYILEYESYFERQNQRVAGIKKQIDPLPRVILLPGLGLIAVGSSAKEAKVNADIAQAWITTVLAAERLGRFTPIAEDDIFDMEYWSLEQAKLGKKSEPALARTIAVVTGGGGAIGAAIARKFSELGAEVAVLDKDLAAAQQTSEACGKHSLAIACDLTNKAEVEHALNLVASTYGGIDIVISNAGAAWQGEMAELPDDVLRRSFELNFFAHQDVAQAAVRHFRLQDFGSSPGSNLGGQLLFNVSKQALNPGKSFGAYGTAKSALLSLMKQYALEEGANGIRANAINADRIRSGLLTTDMISDRAEARGLSEAQYMSGNLLGVEVTAEDVADAFASLALMKSTTGAVLTVDGGNVAAMVR